MCYIYERISKLKENVQITKIWLVFFHESIISFYNEQAWFNFEEKLDCVQAFCQEKKGLACAPAWECNMHNISVRARN